MLGPTRKVSMNIEQIAPFATAKMAQITLTPVVLPNRRVCHCSVVLDARMPITATWSKPSRLILLYIIAHCPTAKWAHLLDADQSSSVSPPGNSVGGNSGAGIGASLGGATISITAPGPGSASAGGLA